MPGKLIITAGQGTIAQNETMAKRELKHHTEQRVAYLSYKGIEVPYRLGSDFRDIETIYNLMLEIKKMKVRFGLPE